MRRLHDDEETIPGPPPRLALLLEPAGLLEPIRLAAHSRQLAGLPRGDDAPVMVLPGFGTTDTATWALRRFLGYLGYDVHGWGLGRNHGRVPELIGQVLEGLENLAVRRGRAVHLVGWSLGGYLAREAARERPNLVTRVITLGSPVVGGPKYTASHRYYLRQGYDLDEIEATVAARDKVPLNVPVTAIYSKRDGVVTWQACIDRVNPGTEHVEVGTSHLGLGLSPDVYSIIARRLAESP
jgi:pimeloyl-ACP methyl ester carboxylesterase